MRSPDIALVDAAQRGDPDALAALYEQFGRAMLRVAYHLTGGRADAEDVLHDVFVGLPDAMRRYQERGQLGAWLQRLVARAALNHVRTRTRRREADIDSPGATGVATQRDASANVLSAMELEYRLLRLPDPLRLVFTLREIEGYSHADIADLLGISVAASEIRLCRAFKALRAHYRTDGES